MFVRNIEGTIEVSPYSVGQKKRRKTQPAPSKKRLTTNKRLREKGPPTAGESLLYAAKGRRRSVLGVSKEGAGWQHLPILENRARYERVT